MASVTLAQQLPLENELTHYIELLEKAAKRFCIFLVVCDTPCGAADFNERLAARLRRALGTNQLLHNKPRYAYVAVVNAGRLIFENISCDTAVTFSGVIKQSAIELRSEKFRVDRNINAYIKIDDIDQMPISTHINNRGINIVIFDIKNQRVIDRVNFDTYLGVVATARSVYTGQDFKDFEAQNPKVTFLRYVNPAFPQGQLSKNEKNIVEQKITRDKILENAGKRISVISEYIDDKEGIYEVLSPPASYIATNGAKTFFDAQGRYVNIVNGHRITVGQPERPKRSIWFLGDCVIYGVGCRDEGTIQSFLQVFLNMEAPEHGFIVHNYGHYLWGDDNMEVALTLLKTLPIMPGDIVFNAPRIKPKISVVTDSYVRRPYNHGELFFDMEHLAENGQKLVANIIFNMLEQYNFFSDTFDVTDRRPQQPDQNATKDTAQQEYGFSLEEAQMLNDYKATLEAFYQQQFAEAASPPTIGAIVMNCNPFTLGHRYLIETAAKQVDMLVVFLVQEDKSVFSFEDRLDLVDKGTQDLSNVAVVVSGKFIISSITFKEYFNKAELQDRIIDSSMDVTLFAKEIAPSMHISIRFVGSEPFDLVTKQYNDMLKVILPIHGIGFKELPRLELDGQAISASRVRQLLDEGDWASIKKLVPATTYDYLLNRFK